MKTDGQLPADTKVRSSKYLNNLIEQDHRGVKLRIGPMLGFKRFSTAAIVIAGIELVRRIHKGQRSTSASLHLSDRSMSAFCLERGAGSVIKPALLCLALTPI